ncbi:MAG: DNA translocase FtsK [Candidatus Babeliales bacterium]
MKLYEKQNSSIRIASYSLSALLIAGTLLCAAIIIALSLFSYDSKDASWFFVRSQVTQRHNMLGAFGAQLAALLMYFFGSASFLIPFVFCFVAYFFLTSVAWRTEFDRFVAAGMLLVCTSALLHSYALDPFYVVAPGGICGRMSYKLFLLIADPTIVFLSLHVFIFISCVLLSRLAWVGPLRKVGHALSYVVNDTTVGYAEQYCARVVRFLFACLSGCCAAIRKCLQRIGSMLSGKLIDEQRDTVPLEFGELVEHVVNDTTDNQFWRTVQGQPYDEQTELFERAIIPPAMPALKELRKEIQTPLVHIARDTKVQHQEQTKYIMPNPVHFGTSKQEKQSADDEALHEHRARMLEQKLARFGITGHVVAIKPGPVITLFEYEPDIDSKVSKILALEDDLAMALEAVSIRIIAPIPGRSVVGFEVANKDRATVHMSAITQSKAYAQFAGHLPLILGHGIVGNPVIVDLADMPHLLVAGSTGSGKSVALNTMLMSLLFRCTPQQLRLILIDPKRLEFASYADIGHLIFPIVTDPRTASPVLQWVVRTMEDRYEIMASVGVRNHLAYQKLCTMQDDLEPMPYIVVMIDELSDLMMTAGKEVEALIARIAQMARAAGIHMIVATQRPSVDVITGLIKVNFPSRISFRVISKVDSRTILDCVGAEKLLGKGDMLFLSASSSLMRVHGAYVGHAEVSKLVEYIRAQQPAHYLDIQEELPLKKGSLLEADDALYEEVLGFVKSTDQISISLLQRRFRIGYNRSARIMETLEADGLIMPSDGSKMRKVIKN